MLSSTPLTTTKIQHLASPGQAANSNSGAPNTLDAPSTHNVNASLSRAPFMNALTLACKTAATRSSTRLVGSIDGYFPRFVVHRHTSFGAATKVNSSITDSNQRFWKEFIDYKVPKKGGGNSPPDRPAACGVRVRFRYRDGGRTTSDDWVVW